MYKKNCAFHNARSSGEYLKVDISRESTASAFSFLWEIWHYIVELLMLMVVMMKSNILSIARHTGSISILALTMNPLKYFFNCLQQKENLPHFILLFNSNNCHYQWLFLRLCLKNICRDSALMKLKKNEVRCWDKCGKWIHYSVHVIEKLFNFSPEIVMCACIHLNSNNVR